MTEEMELELPGFRFHPTEEELLDFYLKNTIMGNKLRFDIIGFLNIYRHDPWDLPGLAKVGEREWYFFVPREKKQGSGGRPNRTTQKGFWKATGSDRKIRSLSDPKKLMGLRKTLVFYKGRAPRGSRTDWVMNEYRLPDTCPHPKDIVLCKIYRKATSMKVLEQRAALEVEDDVSPSTSTSTDTPPSTTLLFKQESPDSFDDHHHHKTSTFLPPNHTISDLHLPSIPIPMDSNWYQDLFWPQLHTLSPTSLFNFT